MDQKNRNFFTGFLIVVILISFYLSPLWLNANKYASLYPKNIPSWYANYYLLLLEDPIIDSHRFPLWLPLFEGGVPYLQFPSSGSPGSPLLALKIFFDDNVSIKIYWVLYFLFGASSMYYLSRNILGYTILGAVFSSLVFSMSGAFAYLFSDGLHFVRETLLLPLLFAFFIKSKENAKYLILTSLVLALMLVYTALFSMAILLFLFLFSCLQSIYYDKRRIILRNDYLKNFLIICFLSFSLSAFKLLPLAQYFSVNNRIIDVTYANTIQQANTLSLFFRRCLLPLSQGAGTMYMGIMPFIAAILGAIFYFKRMKRLVIIAIIFIILSFGSHAFLDIHRILWHIPVFKPMREISKYYSIVIVFIFAILGGRFISAKIFRRRNIPFVLLSLFIVSYSYADLLWSNIGYFNIFTGKFNYSFSKENICHAKVLNVHRGGESILVSLFYFLYKKNIGLIRSDSPLGLKTKVVPKYYLLPKYAFFMPSTALLVISNPEYKSEAFFLNKNNSVKIIDISPNKILVDVKINSQPDMLVINQNFDRSWKSDRGIIENYNGLISLRLNRTENGLVQLTYSPKIIFVGFGISLIAFFSSLYFLLRKNAVKFNKNK
jgi:hypothetical protein